MKKNKLLGYLLLTTLFTASCSEKENELPSPRIPNQIDTTQIDTTKMFVTIGDQTWSTLNLNVDTFKNGDPIPKATTKSEWQTKSSNGPVWCYYNFDESNAKYGKIYNWFAVEDPRGLVPDGYHIPKWEEFEKLATNLGNELVGEKMKSKYDWSDNSTNESGFSALPGGFCDNRGNMFRMDTSGYWWTTTKKDSYNSYSLMLSRYQSSQAKSPLSKGAGAYIRFTNN